MRAEGGREGEAGVTGQASSSPPFYGVDLDDRRQQQSALTCLMTTCRLHFAHKLKGKGEREGESKNRTRGKNERGGPRPDNRERSQRRRRREQENGLFRIFGPAHFSALVTLRFPVVFSLTY